MAENKKKLPKSEWDFSKLNPEQLPYAFFYEYARQSDKIKSLVRVYRELIPYGVNYDSEHEWSFEVKKIKHLSKQEDAVLWSKTEQFKINEYYSLIIWLSFCEKFPAASFIELKTEDYRDMPGRAYGCILPVNGRGLCEIVYCWAKDFKEFNEDPNDRETHMPVGRDFLQPVEKAEAGKEHVSVHLMRVDWWKSDSELQAEFAEWVEYGRARVKVKPVKATSRGLLNRPLGLPKECRKTSTALLHLGKLRCLESSGSWEKYLAVYQEDKSDRRSLEKDVSAARKIIAWLEEKV